MKKAQQDQAPSQRPRPPAAIAQESLIPKRATEPPPAIESLPPAAVPVPPPVIAPPAAVAESTPPSPPAPRVTGPAPAPRPADPAPAIRGVVAEYAGAIESRSVADLRRVYPGMTPLQQRGWEQFFQLVRDVKAQLLVARLDVAGGAADAQITGTYNYLNTSTGRAESQPVSFHAAFKNEAGRWRISQVR